MSMGVNMSKTLKSGTGAQPSGCRNTGTSSGQADVRGRERIQWVCSLQAALRRRYASRSYVGQVKGRRGIWRIAS